MAVPLSQKPINIRKMAVEDIDDIANIHRVTFARQHMSKEWISANFAAFPRMQYYVATMDDVIYGFIHWTQKSGFRHEVVLELEQIAVAPEYRGKGIGGALIYESLPLVRHQLAERGAFLKHIVVTTRADNHAQRLYRKTLGVEVEATITDLYSADEVVMIRRNIDMLT
ncbi:MAG: GNAT family N-acetyltransferase [Cyanobacteria bacterium J06639_14]